MEKINEMRKWKRCRRNSLSNFYYLVKFIIKMQLIKKMSYFLFQRDDVSVFFFN